MFDVAMAQAQGSAPPSAWVSFAPLILVFGVIYFLLIRPQQQKEKEHQQMLRNLKKNDEVITAGGLYGKVVDLKEEVISLEIASNVRVRVNRAQINTTIAAAARNDNQKSKK